MYKFSGCAFLKLLKLKKAYVKNCAGFPLQTTIQLIFFFQKSAKTTLVLNFKKKKNNNKSKSFLDFSTNQISTYF